MTKMSHIELSPQGRDQALIKDALAHQVSVVIPCYNAAPWVARTLASVQAQGDVVAEIIVVDDGSTDASLDVLQPFAAAGDITLLTGPNGGGSHARNRGLAEVKAPYVMFLDADDEIDGDILRGSVQASRAQKADVVFSQMEIRFTDDTPSQLKGPLGGPDQTERQIFEDWFDGGWVNPSAVVWRTAFVRDIGGWNEAASVGDDGDLVLRAMLADAVAGRNEQGRGVYYRGNAGSVSLSGGVTGEKLSLHIEQIHEFCEAARAKGWGDNLTRNYAALYFLGRKAFRTGHPELGHRALAVLHDAGHRGHHGTKMHNLLAGVIGLERKVRWFGS
ncbi:MAG: glycosyltransferase family A protein [Pseudomonadota bacterium]